ncbi:MAG TPA: hypothetical protein VI248_02365 [Kineosporiaceae bacterium]
MNPSRHVPFLRRQIGGRPAYFASGVPVLEADALTVPVPPDPTVGELGAVSFARDVGLWLGRIFDRPVESVVYRENPWDHRPCPRAQSYEVRLAGHVVLITAYDQLTDDGAAVRTVHAITVDGRAVDYDAPRSVRRQAWHLAWRAWRATASG